MDDNNFFSVDKLIEFGMGMAMAQQMVRAMNQSMQSMYVPGSIQSMSPPDAPKVYYVIIDGNQVGPLNEKEVATLVANKSIQKDTLAWMPGMSGWLPVEKVPAILKIIALSPPPVNV